MTSNIALFIDAENISHQYCHDILDKVSQYGKILLPIIYGDWELGNLQSWHQLAEQHNFKIRHQTNSLKAKNAADMRLIMDAMDVLYRVKKIDTFCLVSNDADFVPLCDKLSESGKQVIGVGYKTAGVRFIRACDQFIFIGKRQLITADDEVDSVPSDTVPKEEDNLRKLVIKAFNHADAKNKWITLSTLGNSIHTLRPNFQIKRQGYKNLTLMLSDMPDLVEIKSNGSVRSVRLKNKPHTKNANLRRVLVAAFKQGGEMNRWIPLGELGNNLRKVDDNFSPKTYGHSTLSKLLASIPHTVKVRGKGGTLAAQLIVKSK